MTTPYFTYGDVQQQIAHRSESAERTLFRVAAASAALGISLTLGAAFTQDYKPSSPATETQTWAESPEFRLVLNHDLHATKLSTHNPDVITSDEGIRLSTLLAGGGIACFAIGAAAGVAGGVLDTRRGPDLA